MNVWVYDIEIYPNIFLLVFYNKETKEKLIFEISDRKDDEERLRTFLKTKPSCIGFNNINYDYPVIHRGVLLNPNKINPEEIFKISSDVINSEYSSIWDNKILVPQLDLFKIWHYDNKNKSTSLKWLEFAMRSHDVRDLPYPVGSYLTHDEMDNLISYCIHDVMETYKFYTKSLKHIEIRKFYSRYEGINLMNASEIKISKEIFSKHLAKEMGKTINEVKQLRTHVHSANIKDVIFDYIKFEDPINIQTLERFKQSIYSPYNKIEFSVPYKNVIREYAEGGLHSFGKAGIYESDDEHILLDLDFASFYPHISFMNNLHPKHIPGEIFNKIYKGFYIERKNYPKSDPRNYVLKIILNGSYGLSKDMFSFLYDPKWQLAITINGQLLLTMLTEKVVSKCKHNIDIIFENTDGMMCRIHKNDYDNVMTACKEMEDICKIPLEAQICKRIIIRDVNNYINQIDDTNIKFKGAFEIDRDFHKNHSKRVVPIALANYFLYGVCVEDTILHHLDNVGDTIIPKDKDSLYQNYGIYDFCHGSKMKGKEDTLYSREIKGLEIIDTELARMNRYYVSNEGVELIKKLPPLEKNKLTHTDKEKLKNPSQLNIFDIIEDTALIDPNDREHNIEAGYKCILFNKYKESNDYNINYDYYINECNKIINIFK